MHRRPADYDFFRNLKPPVVKIMDGGKPDYQWVYSNLPEALVVFRDWLLDDNHGNVWTSCLRDPVGTGKSVARQMVAKAQALGLDKSRTLLMGPTNEPNVWVPGGIEAAVQSTVAFADEVALLGWRGLLLNLSVGWPANNDTATVKDTPPNWTPYAPVQSAIRRGNHMLGLHEYWKNTGVGDGWGWYGGRALKCPWDVPIIIGECGFSYAVGRSGIPTVDQGWRKHITDEQYAAQIVDYHNRMAADSRIKGLCLYLCDHANVEWWSKDVEPAYDNILARRSQLREPAQSPSVPVPPTQPPPTIPPSAPAVTLVGKVGKVAPNDGTTYVYGTAPEGSVIYFSWRGNEAIDGIQSGPHAGYEGWKPGYYNIPLYVRGVTPAKGDWDVWAKLGDKQSARVQFATDGKGGKTNQVEVNFVLQDAVTPTDPPVIITPPPPGQAFRFPLDTLKVTQWWGRTHGGIDYSCVTGTPVKACADGVVAWVDDDRLTSAANGGYGLYVRVWHPSLRIHTLYAHLSRQDVAKGQTVTLGQTIGLSGNTGNSTGPHLHWEVRLGTSAGGYDNAASGGNYNGRVDPMAFMAGLERG